MTMALRAIFLLGSVFLISDPTIVIGQALGGRALPFHTVLKNVKGEAFKEGDKDFTLGDASINALDATFEADKSATGKAKQERDELARKIFREPKASLTTEEIAIIKERIGIAYGPPIVGPAWRLIEGVDSK